MTWTLRWLAIACLGLLQSCAMKPMHQAQFAQDSFPLSCPAGTFMKAVDSGGTFKFLRSPVEHDDLEVVRLLQKHGQVPRDRIALLQGVDQGVVHPYHGTGYTLWYFRNDIGIPAKLPWVDAKGACKGASPVVASEFAGWVYAKVPHWARLNVPTRLLVKGEVCARMKDILTVHDFRQSQGTFKDKPGVICSNPEHTREGIANHDGLLFFFITPLVAPTTPTPLNAPIPLRRT